MIQELTQEVIRKTVPSVFATEPWIEQSEKYRFVPTIRVVNALRDAGYVPVKAMQSSCRIPGKKEFVKHVLRFRRHDAVVQVNDIIPEIVLSNSHDGTSAYKLLLGLFRLVCSNGLVVADSTIESIKVRHTGSRDLCQEVIDASATVLNEAPKTLEIVNRWESLSLTRDEQEAYGKAALTAYGSTIDITPDRVLYPRRYADRGAIQMNGGRSLWRTFNTVQENLIKGGVFGRSVNGGIQHTRELKSVDRNLKLNQALWVLAKEMETLKANQALIVNN